jgi:hypothetical protein
MTRVLQTIREAVSRAIDLPVVRRILLPGLALALSALVYQRAPRTFFAQDDITFLSRAAGLESGIHLFRPLSEWLAFWVEFRGFHLDPLGYHLVNLGLHLATVAGVYALGRRLLESHGSAAAAATLFGCSSIAFTPLHWATGVVELLTGTLLTLATILHLEGQRRGAIWRWAAATSALLAMLSKEAACAWVIVILFVELQRGPVREGVRRAVPALTAGIACVVVFAASGQWSRFEHSDPYARTLSPLLLGLNLSTYLKWSLVFWDPFRDLIALVEPGSWNIGLWLGGAAIALGWRLRKSPAVPVGLVWWLVFLLPVLSLARHTYLYYLYVPWIGGAIATAAMVRAALDRLPRKVAVPLGLAALAAYVGVQANCIWIRETATRDSLPVDRTIREAVLLGNALPALREAGLEAGAGVLFVSPVTRPRFDLITGAPTRPEDLAQRRSYRPLEAAMRGGETLRLFVPAIRYLGFAKTISKDREWADCFHYGQRGELEYWGRGQDALLRQGLTQLDGHLWVEAESTFTRVRSLRDTIPAALVGQIRALTGEGRTSEAQHLLGELMRRWPNHPS